jgi:translocation and assembly module TamB
MADTRRIRRWVALGFGGLLLSALLLLGLAYGWAQSESGRAWIAGRLSEALSLPGETEVSIGRLEGRLPHAPRIRTLALADADGTWLEARSIEIDWRPWSLLDRVVDVTNLTADEIRVARLPRAGPDAAEEPAMPALPRWSLRVGSLEITPVELGEALLGEAASLRIAGALRTDAARAVHADLTVERIDGTAGRADLSATYGTDEESLDLVLRVEEPAGGLLARALAIGELPALRVSLQGEGPLADWHGRLIGALVGLASVDLELAIARGEALTFAATGGAESLYPSAALPLSLLKGRSKLALEGSWGDRRVLVLDRAVIETDSLELSLAGRLDTATGQVEAKARGTLSDAAFETLLPGGIQASGLGLSATAEGPLLQPDLRLDAVLAHVALPGVEAKELTAQVDFVPSLPLTAPGLRGDLKAEGRAEAVAFAKVPELEAVLAGGLSWRLAGDLDLGKQHLTVHAAALEADRARVSAEGEVSLGDGHAKTQVRVEIEDLSRLASLIGLDLRGDAALAGQVTIGAGDAIVAADLAGPLRGFALGLPIADDLLSGDVDLAAKLAWGPEGLKVRGITAVTSRADLIGEVRLDPSFERVAAEYRLAVADAGLLSARLGVDLSGAASLEGRAEGPVGNPALDGRLRVGRVLGGPFAFDDVSADFRIHQVAPRPSGQIAASARAPFGPVSGETAFEVEETALVLGGLRLNSQETTVEGSARVPLEGGPLEAALQVRADDLAPWLSYAGLAGRGQGEGRVTLTPEDGRQGADLAVEFAGLVLDAGEAPPVAAAAATARLHVDDAFGQAQGTLRLEAEGVTAGALQLKRFALDLDGDLEAADARLGATGSWQGPLELEAAGRIERAQSDVDLRLATLDGRLRDQAVHLEAPARLLVGAESAALEGLDLAYGPARLQAEGRVGPSEIAASLSVAELPGQLLAPLWPAEITATLSGQARIEGPRAAPSGQLQLRARDLRVADLGEAPPLQLDLEGDWAKGRLAVRGLLRGAAEEDARLEADLPLRLHPEELSLDVPRREPLSASLDWRGDLAGLAAILPLAEHELSGTADIGLEATGSLSEPRLRGRATLAGGRYESLQVGTLLQDINLAIDLLDGRAEISVFAAADGRGGRLSAEGSAKVDVSAGHPYHLTATLEDLLLVRRDEATGSASGRLSLEGDLRRGRLTGQMESGTVEIRVPDRLPADVAELDVIEQDGPGVLTTTQVSADKRPLELDLDVTLDMPRQVFVRGRGLDSEWGGRLHVGGTAARPRIVGELSLVRGQFAFAGKQFELDRGVISFPEAEEIAPLIDVAAVNTAKGMTVTVRVSGPATDPRIELSSVPELPQDEILARVLYDKSAGQLSAYQAAQMAAAFAQLSGKGGAAGGLLDLVRSGLGLDVLRLGTVETPGGEAPAATVGKYATEEVFVGVTQGTGPETGSVGVEVELTPNISVESEVGQTGQSKAGVKFKLDY